MEFSVGTAKQAVFRTRAIRPKMRQTDVSILLNVGHGRCLTGLKNHTRERAGTMKRDRTCARLDWSRGDTTHSDEHPEQLCSKAATSPFLMTIVAWNGSFYFGKRR